MKPNHVVLSLPVRSTSKSFHFYHDGLGLAAEKIGDDIVTLELPGLSLFLVSQQQFEKSSKIAAAFPPENTSGCLLSCSISTKAEVDDTLKKVTEAEGTAYPSTTRTLFGRKQYVAYFKDPDGHPWELVWNMDEATP
jgi:uncharacterized protein